MTTLFLMPLFCLSACSGAKPEPTPTELAERLESQKRQTQQNRRNDDFLAESKQEMVNIKSSDLKTGDLLLIRLPSDVSYQFPFQHVLWVAIDPTDSSLKTLSIFPTQTLAFSPIPDPVMEGKTRILHLRLKDRSLAEKSSQMIVGLWKTKEQAGQPIEYDKDSDLREHNKLTSLEVAQVALEMGSEGKFKIADRIDELEIDPHFEVIKEWRDLKSLPEMRKREAIQNQIEYWKDEFAYRSVSRQLTDLELENLILKGITLITADQGSPLTYSELVAALENFRKSDLALFENSKTRSQSVMHRQFRVDPKTLRKKAKQQAAPKDPKAGMKYPALEF